MSRCFPFPPPGYEKENKLSNGELGHLHKKIKHKDKKEKKKNKKDESKDEDQVSHVTEKKDKKHKHHKHKKDKRKGRHGEHEFEDIKRVGVAQDSPTRRGAVSIKFVETERPGTGRYNKVDISDSEGSRQNKDKIRDNGMGGNQKMDEDRGNSDGNARKKKKIDTSFFLGLGDAEDSLIKRETIGIKFVERERQGNGKCAKIDLSEREELRRNNCKTRENGMAKDQNTGKDGGKSNGKIGKGKEIDMESSLPGGNAQEIPKKREAVSIRFVERERLCNGKCEEFNLLDKQKLHADRDNNNGIVRKRNEIDSNSSHGDRPWVHLPVLTDKDKWSTKHYQTTLAKEVYSDIGRTAQEAKNLVVECISTSHVQNASNRALGKSVDSTGFHPSLSGRNKWSLKSPQTTFTKKVYFNSGKTVQEVKDGPVECIRKTRLEEASNASSEKCIASTSCHPLFSGKDKQFNKCPQAACAEEINSDIGNKVQDTKSCAVGCIPGSTVQKVSKASPEKCVASVSCYPSITGKEKCSNKRSRTASIEDFHSESWRKVQDSKDCAVECLPESRIQRASNAALEKCVASTSCHPPCSIKDKRSIKHLRTIFPEEVLFDSGRLGQEENGVSVECKNGSRVQEASTTTLQKCDTSCLPSFSGKDCERNGVADFKTTSNFVGPSHGTTEAVDVVPSGSRTDEHILDLKYFYSVPPKQGFSDLDDQAWLFLSNGRKPKATEKFDHASNVWDRLLVLEPYNTYALPYVTPF